MAVTTENIFVENATIHISASFESAMKFKGDEQIQLIDDFKALDCLTDETQNTSTAVMMKMSSHNASDISDMSNICDSGFEFFRWFVYIFIVGPLIVFGIFGNGCTFMVLLRKYRYLAIGVLLLTMTFIDTVLLILMAIVHLWMIGQMCHGVLLSHYHYMAMYRICYPLVYIMRMSTMGITVCLTWNRWLLVCRPFEAKFRLRPALSIKQIVFVVLAACLFAIPRFFELEMAGSRLQTTWLLKNKLYNVAYRIIAFSLCMYIVPISYMLRKCLEIFRGFRTSIRNRRCSLANAADGCSAEVALGTRTTLYLIVMNICCNAPALITHILWSLSHFDDDLRFLHQPHVTVLSNAVIALGSAANIVVYCWFGPEFRRQLWRMFGCGGSEEGENMGGYAGYKGDMTQPRCSVMTERDDASPGAIEDETNV